MSSKTEQFENRILTANQKATKAIQKATADLNAIAVQLQTSVDQVAIVDEVIAERQLQLVELDKQYDLKFDEAQYNLRIKVRDNEDKVLAELLKARGLAHISLKDLEDLNEKLEQAEAIAKREKEIAVSSAVASTKTQYEAKIMAMEADVKVKEAQIGAETSALTRERDMLQGQVKDLQGMIQAEREASVKKAEADAGKQGVIVNTARN